MKNLKRLLWLMVGLWCLFATAACKKDCSCKDSCADTSTTDNGSDTEKDSATDSESDSDSDDDPDAGTDADGGMDLPDSGPILPDCGECEAVGSSLEHMRCAVELCDDDVFVDQVYDSPSNAPVEGTYEAVTRFGDSSNHLTPLENDSYAVMASGMAIGTDHDWQLYPAGGVGDPFSRDGQITRDVMEWRVRLKAPANARGIQISYVFFSAEYDEYVGSTFNDKFYIILEAGSTNDGYKSVINFTKCRDPDAYYDRICTKELSEMGVCEKGDKLCFIAINTAFSECCWHNDCPLGTWTTDISGTGFSCADSSDDETIEGAPNMDLGKRYGSSSGWLVTEWPIWSNEEFILTFHIHDTKDARLDSAVIIDRVVFIAHEAVPGTAPI